MLSFDNQDINAETGVGCVLLFELKPFTLTQRGSYYQDVNTKTWFGCIITLTQKLGLAVSRR